MSTVTNLRAIAPALPEVVGYVEAVTADRLLGWAWAPASPDLRAAIEVRLGEEIVAHTVADLPRPDLATNGIGDGRHAFEVAIPVSAKTRPSELRVYARAGDGDAVAIGAPPAADGLSEQVTKLLRGVDMLLNSQRLIHRNLQAALAGKADDKPAEAQLASLERFVMRLDDHLSKLPSSESPPAFPRFALWALGISGAALLISIFQLARSLGS
jgi:hypothetical protein